MDDTTADQRSSHHFRRRAYRFPNECVNRARLQVIYGAEKVEIHREKNRAQERADHQPTAPDRRLLLAAVVFAVVAVVEAKQEKDSEQVLESPPPLTHHLTVLTRPIRQINQHYLHQSNHRA